MDDLLERAQESGAPVEVVIGFPPDPTQPWNSAHRGRVTRLRPRVVLEHGVHTIRFRPADVQAIRFPSPFEDD